MLHLYHHQVSKLLVFSILVMIIGFATATPLSLLLTIPAYILADRVSRLHCIYITNSNISIHNSVTILVILIGRSAATTRRRYKKQTVPLFQKLFHFTEFGYYCFGYRHTSTVHCNIRSPWCCLLKKAAKLTKR